MVAKLAVVIRSKIATTASFSSRIGRPSDGSNHSHRHSAIGEEQNTKGLASQSAPEAQ